MNKTTTRKPIQAGDYGKTTPETAAEKNSAAKPVAPEASNQVTDGRKTLALWS